MEVVNGSIVSIDPDNITIRVPYHNLERAIHRQYDQVQVGLQDGRTITPVQRKKAYALLGEIASYGDDFVSRVKLVTKHDFIRDHLDGLRKELFSLSNCDVTTARGYISYLIELVLEYDIPTKVPLVTLCDDIRHYVYVCLLHKKCAVCGRKADLHHVDRVGMGGDRRHMNHIGMEALPLCREHHNEEHNVGEQTFKNTYHLEPVEIDEKIAKVYKLRTKGKKHG